jgi:hypothetical protein
MHGWVATVAHEHVYLNNNDGWPDWDAAIEFYAGALGFELQEDVDSGGG